MGKIFEKDIDGIRKHPQEVIKQLMWNRSAWRQRCYLILH